MTEVARRFSEFLNRVSYRGESFRLVRGGRVIAELRPAPQGVRLGELPALLGSLPRLGPGEDRDFARDVASARKRLNKVKPRDPWAS